jgi:CHAD domain-containing protein
MLPDPKLEKKTGLAYWAARVLTECDNAAIGFTADPVHDLRVAIRRCRSLADGFRSIDPDPAWKQMKRMAKPLFSSLGELRDVQVMLEWVEKLAPPNDPLAQELCSVLLQREELLKAAAQQSLGEFDRKHWLSLNAHLAQRSDNIPLEGPVFQHLALQRWFDAHDLHRRALRNRSGAAWHQLRIGIKRFRYTVENFLPQRHEKWSRDLRDLQDALGEVHDFDVLRALVNDHASLHPEGRDRWLQRIAEERQKRIDLYRQKMLGRGSLWPVWRQALPAGKELDAAALETLRTWASLLDSHTERSDLVARLALAIHDGLSQCGILQCSPRARQLLEAAALLQEIGAGKPAANTAKRHAKRARRRIEKLTSPVGWTAEEMRTVAALVRFSTGALPNSRDSVFVGLDRKGRRELMCMIGVLRLANALDDGQPRQVRGVNVSCKDGAVVMACIGLQPMSREAERVARARYLLETVCRRPIVIRPVRDGQTARARAAARIQSRAAQTA